MSFLIFLCHGLNGFHFSFCSGFVCLEQIVEKLVDTLQCCGVTLFIFVQIPIPASVNPLCLNSKLLFCVFHKTTFLSYTFYNIYCHTYHKNNISKPKRAPSDFARQCPAYSRSTKHIYHLAIHHFLNCTLKSKSVGFSKSSFAPFSSSSSFSRKPQSTPTGRNPALTAVCMSTPLSPR